MTDKERLGLAKEEYFYLQGAYERFDSAFFQIKSWSVTLGAAGILAALNLKSNQPIAFLMIGAMALTFWYMDITWKIFQRAHLPRIIALEAFLKGANAGLPVPDIRDSWKATFDEMTDRRRNGDRKAVVAIFAPNLSVPHVIILAASLVFAALSAGGLLQGDQPEPPKAAISIAQD